MAVVETPSSSAGLAETLHAPFEHLRPLEEGVFSAEQAGVEHLTGCIGNIAVLATRSSTDPAIGKARRRRHDLISVDVDDFSHRMWVTQPVVESDDPLTVVAKPGWGEMIEDGVGWQMHQMLAKRMPQAKIISHATHGVGPSASRLGIRDLSKQGIDEMAEQGLKLLGEYCKDEKVVYVGTSMGTVIGNKLLNLNLDHGRPIDFAAAIYYAPALVDPKKVVKDMGFRFFPEMMKDAAQELLVRTELKRLLGAFTTLAASRPGTSDLLPLARQGLDLLKGTPQAEIERVLNAYNVAVITGTTDPVGQYPMWQELSRRFPVRVIPVHGRGHGMAIKPFEGSKKIAATIKDLAL